ncbi:MAG TPA: NUDIX hydrolase [Steroidobacteraceae bacterium]|jgi:ADP-ribose pyrophosphatase|nr:NUDIX hydrolase [Steroidobacteraceae bacterium]
MTLEKRTTHFTGRVITVTVDEVTLPNGHRAALEIVHHPGGAAIAAIDDKRRICLLRQYRHAAGDWMWELPAGKLEPGEPPLVTAQRELVEEAGRHAAHWESLGRCIPSPGVLAEVVHLFLATRLETVPDAPESGEVFEAHWVPLQEAWAQVLDGTINDAKTALGIARAMARPAA